MKRSKHQSNISLIINTKDEAHNLADCILSCRPLVSEVVVCDMHSSDQTVTIAKKLGARVISIPDAGFVEPGRNIAIQHGRGNWILVMDADERLSAPLRVILETIAKNDVADVVRIPRKNIFFGQWLQHSIYWPDYQVRFFKKKKVRWLNDIHSQPRIVSNARVLDVPAKSKYAILHHYATTVELFAKKMIKQAEHENDFLLLPQLNPSSVYQEIVGQFRNRYFRDEGYKDGVAGLIVAKFYEYYRFLAFVYTWQKIKPTKPNTYQSILKIWKDSDVATDKKSSKLIYQQQQEIEELKDQLSTIKDSKLFKYYNLYEKIKDAIYTSVKLNKP